ncbi:unnamed protein product [Sphagnum tenellum]
MRNGDYPPTRFQAQADAVNLICGAKTQSNPENTVGVLTMAGKGPRVLITPTNDLGKILQALHGLEVGGQMNLTSGVQVAQLALKHRQNKHQRQRIILFAGSPVLAEKKLLEVIGKKLKKNNVALDIVSFGEEDSGENGEKLEALLGAVNSNDNSHIVHIPWGERPLSDILISSSIFTGDGEGSGFAAAAAAGAAAAAAAAAGGAGGFDFGVDPNLDPELALALRVSMEEERARQEAASKRAADEAIAKDGHAGESSGAPDVIIPSTTGIAMSMAEAAAAAAAAGASSGDVPMVGSGGDDQDLAFALQMSMQEEAALASGENADMSKVLVIRVFFPQFFHHFDVPIYLQLPGVDPNDPSVQDVLASLQADDEEQKKDKTESKDKEGQ